MPMSLEVPNSEAGMVFRQNEVSGIFVARFDPGCRLVCCPQHHSHKTFFCAGREGEPDGYITSPLRQVTIPYHPCRALFACRTSRFVAASLFLAWFMVIKTSASYLCTVVNCKSHQSWVTRRSH